MKFNNKKLKESSKIWLRRHIKDPYVKEAKEKGYRSRATFKIREIDSKFKLFKRGLSVIDLGASPGGWSEYVVKQVGNGNIIAIDLLEMEEIKGVKFLQCDFLKEEENINNFMFKNFSEGRCDIILSDMSQNISGNSSIDHIRIVALLENVMKFAKKSLKTDGSLVAKIFQGGAQGELLLEFKKRFKKIKHFKPLSSRKSSSENYIIGMGFRDI